MVGTVVEVFVMHWDLRVGCRSCALVSWPEVCFWGQTLMFMPYIYEIISAEKS